MKQCPGRVKIFLWTDSYSLWGLPEWRQAQSVTVSPSCGQLKNYKNNTQQKLQAAAEAGWCNGSSIYLYIYILQLQWLYSAFIWALCSLYSLSSDEFDNQMRCLCGWTLLEVGASAAADEQSVSGEGHALVFSDVRQASVCVSRRLSHRHILQ